MIYQKISPSAALQPYVMCYYIWEHDELLSAPLEIHSPPNGLAAIVFNYGNPHYTLHEDGKWKILPHFFAAGQFTKNYALRLQGKIGMIGVVFWPAGLTHVLGTPMIEFTNQRIELNLVLGNRAAMLEYKLAECNTAQERIKTLEKFLLCNVSRTQSERDIVNCAVKTIIHKKGILSISQLSDDLCISPRQLRRRFTEKVGITPKMCARIKRFNYVTNLSFDAFPSWLDMVHTCGYYDQAHFIRDVSDFSGRSPTEFMHYQQQMVQMMGA
jgi:AraC-like DNA-binding protein